MIAGTVVSSLVCFVVMLVCYTVLKFMLTYQPHAVLDYDKRWDDESYVWMIHATRDTERSLGIEQTPCECAVHTFKLPKVPAGPAPGASRINQYRREEFERNHGPRAAFVSAGAERPVQVAKQQPCALCGIIFVGYNDEKMCAVCTKHTARVSKYTNSPGPRA